MLIYKNEELQEYIRKSVEDFNTNERYFVKYAREYWKQNTEKVLAISGLRGTGKTIGLLQSLTSIDGLYICCQRQEDETGLDYVKLLKETDKRFIVIDEYSWIQDRTELDFFLYTCIQNGKRIIITGTESVTLDFLNYGNLIHRVNVIHTTLFTYDEFLHVYKLEHNKNNCKKFLIEGGVFSEYAITNYASMAGYIKTAIVDNLAGYFQGKYDEQLILQVVYTVLYKAICSSTETKMSVYTISHVPMIDFLDRFGIDTSIDYSGKQFQWMLETVTEILEQIGVIVKITNAVTDYDYEYGGLEDINLEKTPKYKSYVVNPSLTCQLIKAIYDLKDIDGYVLGNVYEACMMSYLASYVQNDDKLYFVDLRYRSGKCKELDALVIRGVDERYLYLFECKYKAKAEVNVGNTIVSAELKEFLSNRFENSVIDGNCFVYTGDEKVLVWDDTDFLFVPLDERVKNYSFIPDEIERLKVGTEPLTAFDK